MGGPSGGMPTGAGAGGSPGAPMGAGAGGSSSPGAPMGAGPGGPSSAGGSGSLPGGAGRFGSGSFGSGGFGFGGAATSTEPLTRLPAYRFRLSQRRLMTVTFMLQNAMKPEGLANAGLLQTGAAAAEVGQVSIALDALMKGAQAGITDKEDLDLTPTLKSYRDAIRVAAESLEALIPAEAGAAAAEGAASVDPFDN